MTSENSTATSRSNGVRILVIAVLVTATFFGAYKFAQALTAPKADGQTAVAAGAAGGGAPGAPASQSAATGSGAAGSGAAAGGGSACACCGTGAPTTDGVSGDKIEGVAKQTGGVQQIAVDLSSGTYNPNVIKLKAGVPAEITFGQSSGCTAQVTSNDLGFFEDLSQGSRTVKLDGLDAGTYSFSCGMQMVFGKIVVE